MRHEMHPDSDAFRRDVDLLCRSIEVVACKAGATEADCDDPQRMFAVMPLSVRQDIVRVLDHHVAQDEGTDSLTLAARYLIKLAREVWDSEPPPTPSGNRGAVGKLT